MEIIIRPIGAGKTTELIKKAHESGSVLNLFYKTNRLIFQIWFKT